MGKRISHCQGKGSLNHNNRTFTPKNIDPERIKDNVVLVQESLAEAYDKCFLEAIRKYNEKQTRADRKVDENYFRHLFGKEVNTHSVCTGSNKQKSFYEDLIQIGDMNDTGVGTPDAEAAKEVLKEYFETFRERNPNFYVFNAVIHMDEATPHLHIDYIPLGHYSRGLSVQNGLAQALKEMGFGTGKDAINRWRLKERATLEEICKRHKVEIEAPNKARGYSFTTDEYKVLKEEEKALKKEIKILKQEAAEMREISQARKNIDEIPVKTKGFNSDKVELAADDWRDVKDIASMNFVLMSENDKLSVENERLNKAVGDTFALRKENAELKTKMQSHEKTISDLKGKLTVRDIFLKEHGLIEKFNTWIKEKLPELFTKTQSKDIER